MSPPHDGAAARAQSRRIRCHAAGRPGRPASLRPGPVGSVSLTGSVDDARHLAVVVQIAERCVHHRIGKAEVEGWRPTRAAPTRGGSSPTAPGGPRPGDGADQRHQPGLCPPSPPSPRPAFLRSAPPVTRAPSRHLDGHPRASDSAPSSRTLASQVGGTTAAWPPSTPGSTTSRPTRSAPDPPAWTSSGQMPGQELPARPALRPTPAEPTSSRSPSPTTQCRRRAPMRSSPSTTRHRQAVGVPGRPLARLTAGTPAGVAESTRSRRAPDTSATAWA